MECSACHRKVSATWQDIGDGTCPFCGEPLRQVTKPLVVSSGSTAFTYLENHSYYDAKRKCMVHEVRYPDGTPYIPAPFDSPAFSDK